MSLSISHRRSLIAITAGFVIFLLDGFFKYIALKTFPNEWDVLHWSLIEGAIHRNYGITFDIPIPLPLVIVITIIIIAILIIYTKRLWQDQPRQSTFAILVILGATGNLLDRIINGFTTDYLIFFARSAVNLSDGLILIGVLGLILGQGKSHVA